MTAIIYLVGRAIRRFGLPTLVAMLPALVYAQPTVEDQLVKALTTNSSGELVVLRDTGLFTIKGGASTRIPLPMNNPQAHASTLAKGADSSVYLGGPGMGVWRYDSAGERWQSLNKTLPSLDVTAIAAHATQPATLYAYYLDKGMFRSIDGGDEWVKVDNGPREPVQAFLHSDMPGSMETGWLFSGTTRGVSRSMDCFCLWSDAGDLRGTVSAISYDPVAPLNVYAVITGAIYHSADGGQTWKSLQVPQTVTAIVFSPIEGLVVGTATGKLLFRNAAREWVQIDE